MNRILSGNWMMVVCSAFYLLWWIIAFKPGAVPHPAVTRALLVLAFAAGAAGVALIGTGMRALGSASSLFPSHAVLIGGAAVYVILLLLTSLLLKRQVTTELFLIVGWAMLEISVADAAFGCGRLGKEGALMLCAVVAAAAAVSLVCYLLYYGLETKKGYIDGMIPLLLSAAVMTGVNAVCR